MHIVLWVQPPFRDHFHLSASSLLWRVSECVHASHQGCASATALTVMPLTKDAGHTYLTAEITEWLCSCLKTLQAMWLEVDIRLDSNLSELSQNPDVNVDLELGGRELRQEKQNSRDSESKMSSGPSLPPSVKMSKSRA